jgi:hypothetical protein
MEIIIAVVVIGLIGYWAYTNFNKQKPDGSHVLDTLTKPAESAPYKVPEPSAEVKFVAEMSYAIHDTDKPVVTPAKKPPAKRPPAKRGPAVKKTVALQAPAKPRAKKAPKQ